MHVRPGYREKAADLQGTLKLCDFITEFQGRTDAAMNIGMHILQGLHVLYHTLCGCSTGVVFFGSWDQSLHNWLQSVVASRLGRKSQ